jgi:hypothetical protein
LRFALRISRRVIVGSLKFAPTHCRRADDRAASLSCSNRHNQYTLLAVLERLRRMHALLLLSGEDLSRF